MTHSTPRSRRTLGSIPSPLMGMTQTTWDEAITGWTTAMRAAGRPQTTVRTRTQHVRQLRSETKARCPWDLSERALVAWLADHEWKLSSRRAARTSLVSFYSWARKAGYINVDPTAELPVVRQSPPAPHPVPEDMLDAVLAKAKPRERLMIQLAGRCGLRRGEVAKIHTRDVFLGPGGWSLRVHGKGSKERVVPLPDDLARAILAHGVGYLFPGKEDGHLSVQWVGDLISDLLPPGWSMHALRHRFASRAYHATGDLLSVQQLLGHTSPAVTQAYVQVPDTALRKAMLSAA